MAARAVPMDPIRRDREIAGATARAAGAPDAPVFVAEAAARLGYRAHYFRRHQVIARLIADKGMPSPLPVPGWLRWDRPRFYAWLAGRAVPLAANDIAPALPAEDDIDAQRALLHEAYSRRAG
jgi:hypothetical protein